MTPEQAFSHPFISRAVNELKCLKDQPQEKSSSAAEGGSSKQTLNTTGNGDQVSQRSYAGGKTKSGSKLPTIRKN